jgi:hypothetical protein
MGAHGPGNQSRVYSLHLIDYRFFTTAELDLDGRGRPSLHGQNPDNVWSRLAGGLCLPSVEAFAALLAVAAQGIFDDGIGLGCGLDLVYLH